MTSKNYSTFLKFPYLQINFTFTTANLAQNISCQQQQIFPAKQKSFLPLGLLSWKLMLVYAVQTQMGKMNSFSSRKPEAKLTSWDRVRRASRFDFDVLILKTKRGTWTKRKPKLSWKGRPSCMMLWNNWIPHLDFVAADSSQKCIEVVPPEASWQGNGCCTSQSYSKALGRLPALSRPSSQSPFCSSEKLQCTI